MSVSAVSMPGHLWRTTWFCVVFLLAQTLGQLHGLTHVSGHSSQAVVQASQVLDGALHRYAEKPDGHNAHDALPADLFASHSEGSADCLAFDQLSHFDTLVSFSLALPMVLTPFQLTASAGLAVARWHAQFQARGPPFPH